MGAQLKLVSGQNCSGAFCLGAAGGQSKGTGSAASYAPLLTPPMLKTCRLLTFRPRSLTSIYLYVSLNSTWVTDVENYKLKLPLPCVARPLWVTGK